MIQIISIQNPFERRYEKTEVAYTALTLDNYVMAEMKDIYLNGKLITNIKNTYPLDGDQLIVMPHVAGGGITKLLGYAAMIALAYYSGSIASNGWKLFGIAAHSFGAALVSGAVLYLGGKLINSVFKIAATTDNSSSTTYGWNLPTTLTSEGGIIGETYGECIPAPTLLEEHVETVDDTQYLNLLYCGGYGPVDSITDLRIDLTDIGCFDDVQKEIRLGTNDQAPISFFTNTPLDQTIGLELSKTSAITRTSNSTKATAIEVTVEFPAGLYHMSNSGSYNSATVKIGIAYRLTGTTDWNNKHVSLGNSSDLSISSLSVYDSATAETWTITPITTLVSYDSNTGNETIAYTGGYTVEGSVTGETANATLGTRYDNGKINFTITDVASKTYTKTITVSDMATFSVKKSQSSAVRKSFKLTGLPQNQYDVKVILLSQPTGSRYCTVCNWSLLTSYDEGTYSRPNKVLVALRIKATSQLSSSIPNLTWRQTRSIVYVWNPDTSTYDEKAANNPIWAAYDILHGCRKLLNINTGAYEYVVEGTAKENLIPYYDQFIEAAAYADEQIKNQDGDLENRFEFDAFYDTAQKRIAAAQKAAAVGHSTIIPHGKYYGIVTDKQGEIVQIFGEGRTTVSSVSGSFSSSDDRAKSVEITYNDSANNFKNTVFMLRSPTYAADLSVQDNTAQLSLFGVKRRSQAYREGIYTLATNERQLQTVEFKTDVDGVVAEYGDIVGYNHAVSKIGMASGRIVSVEGNIVTMDKEVTLVAGTTYEIIIQLSATDKIISRSAVVTATGDTNQITVSAAFDDDKMPVKYDVYAFGEVDKAVKPFRISKIGKSQDLLCSLTVIEYSEAIYATTLDYSNYPIIDYTPASTLLAPTGVSLAEENYRIKDGTNISQLHISWDLPKGAKADTFEVSYSTDNELWTVWESTQTMVATITGVQPLNTYYIAIKSVADGAHSTAATASLYITGKDAAPADITGLTATQLPDATKLKLNWDTATDVDLKGYRIYVNGVLESNILTDAAYEYTATKTQDDTFAVVAVDNSGNESENEAILTMTMTVEPKTVAAFAANQRNSDRSIIDFSWTANTEIDLSYYEIRRGDSWDAGTTIATKLKATNFGYKVSGNGYYRYWIKAYNTAGYASVTAIMVGIQVNLTPSAVSNLTAIQSRQDKSNVVITWTASPGNDIAGYTVKYGDTWDTGTVIATTQEITVAWSVPASGAYNIMVQATTAAGYTSSVTNTTVAVAIEPLDVTGFTAIQSTTDRTRITLSWSAPSEVDVSYYIIKEGTNWDEGTTITPRVSGTLYDVIVGDEAEHTWMIKAVTIAGHESQYATAISGMYDLRPSTVMALQAGQSANDRSLLIIQWAAVTDGDLTGYQVKIGDTWDAGEPLPLTQELYRTYNLTASGGIKIMIKSQNAAGYYSDETSITVTAQVEPVDVTGFIAFQNGDSIDLYWDKAADTDITGYEIREGASFDAGSLVATGVSVTNYTVSIGTERVYQYWIKAINSSGHYSKTQASAGSNVTSLSPKNVIETFDEILLADGTHSQTEFGQSLINFRNMGGKWSEYPTTKFSDVGGDSVLKLLKDSTGTYYSGGTYLTAVLDMGAVITADVTVRFISTVILKGTGTAVLEIQTSRDNATWLDWQVFKPAQRTFRYIRFRITLGTADITKTPEVNQFTISIDVPDTDIAVTASIVQGGTTVNYGHTFYTVPVVVPMAVGENLHAELISKTEADCIIKIKDKANTDVGGTADIRIKGY